MSPILFDPTVAPKRVDRSADKDPVVASSVNFYEGVTKDEVEAFYKEMSKDAGDTPISYGLNSKLVKSAPPL